MTAKQSDILNFCPHCKSPNTVYKEKAQEWECHKCERRFELELPSVFKSFSDKARKPKNIFFSYGHDEHKELVVMFKNDLELRGHSVWFDENRIGVWDDWKEKITRGIHDSQMAVAYMSKHSLRDPGVCRNEIAMALSRFGVVYPVKVEEGIEDDIPVTIRNLQWPDLSEWRRIQADKVPGENWKRWYEARLIELIDKIENEASEFAWEAEALRKVLQPVAFESHFARYLESFVGRDWIMDAYHDWVSNQPDSRVFWIKALPGFGKTTLAVNLAARERGTVVSRWFCEHGREKLRNPKAAIRTLVFQLAVHYDSKREQLNDKPMSDYRRQLLSVLEISPQTTEEQFNQIIDRLNKSSTDELFKTLLAEPLAHIIEREHQLVILIDALDEATDEEGNNALVDFFVTHLASLPKWIKFVVTSRSESVVSAGLQGFKPFVIDAEDSRNIGDLRVWYAAHLFPNEALQRLPETEQQRIEKLLIERSEGMFLFLTTIAEGLRERSLVVADLDNMLYGVPGLNAVYTTRFKHRFGQGFSKAVHVKELVRLLVVAPGVLPVTLACELLGWNEEQLSHARLDLGSYLIESRDGLKLFHKSLADWLTNKKDNHFWVDVKPARQRIADALFAELEKEQDMQRWSSLAAEWLHYWRSEQLTQWDEPKSLNNLGCALNRSIELHEIASFYHQSALEILKQQHSSGVHEDIAKTLYHLGGTVSGLDSYATREEAIEFSRQALDMQRQLYPDEAHLDIAKTLYRLGDLSLGAYLDTHPDCYRGEPLKTNCDDPYNIRNIVAKVFQAQRMEELHEVINYLERALMIVELLYPNSAHTITASIRNKLAQACEVLGTPLIVPTA